MKIYKTTGRSAQQTAKLIARLEQRGNASVNPVLTRVQARVSRIVRDVQRGGDKALRRYAAKLDGLEKNSPLLIPEHAMQAALEGLPQQICASLEAAAANIRAFAQKQLPAEWEIETTPGVVTGQCVRPLGAVGCYVPSGRHPLPSTLLMTVIPAQVAGVERIVVVSPRPSSETMGAAALLGVKEFYAIGGAHAVAALAYGTPTLPRVDKIVGPGNLYVTAAKKLVAHDCSIDMLAGPTEIGIMSETGDAVWIASDLVAQAEHDDEALAIFITTNKKLAKAVLKETTQQGRKNKTAIQSLKKNGYVFLAASIVEARALANRLALEHLTVDSEEALQWITSAGSVFVGKWSAQPLGDYISGPNHTLPTGGLARTRGGLSVFDYVKLITVQRYTQAGVETLGPAAISLAECEGLGAHAAAIELRLNRE